MHMRECRERLPRNRGLAIPPCITHVRDAPGIPSACTTRHSTYLTRGPWSGYITTASGRQLLIWYPLQPFLHVILNIILSFYTIRRIVLSFLSKRVISIFNEIFAFLISPSGHYRSPRGEGNRSNVVEYGPFVCIQKESLIYFSLPYCRDVGCLFWIKGMIYV